jgi:hypothetical protein
MKIEHAVVEWIKLPVLFLKPATIDLLEPKERNFFESIKTDDRVLLKLAVGEKLAIPNIYLSTSFSKQL